MEKDIAISRKDLCRIDDCFKGRWKNGSAFQNNQKPYVKTQMAK